MIKFLKVKVICLICVSFCSNLFAQKTYILKQNLPIGKKFDFSMVSDQIINQKIGGVSYNMTQTIGTDYVFSIRNGDNLEKDIEVTYNRIFMNSSIDGKKIIMDSNDQDSTKQNPFREIKGASFNMKIVADGSVKSITGIEQMVNNMASKMSKDSLIVKRVKTAMSQQFNSESMKQTMDGSLKIYPEKPIKIGESWVVSNKINMTMPIESITKYTLKEVKNGIAYLIIDGNLISKGNFEMMGNKMQTDLTGTNAGDAELDLKTGLLINSHLRMELMGTMNSMGQNINFNLQGINKIVSKEVN